MFRRTRLLPVLIATLALAVTPVLASADAVPKDARAELEKEIVTLVYADGGKGLSGGELVAWVAKTLKDSKSDLATNEQLAAFNHGQIVSAIAHLNKGDDTKAVDQDKEDEADNSGKAKGKTAKENVNKGKAAKESVNKGKNAADSDIDDENDVDDGDEDATSTDEQRGKSADHKQQATGKNQVVSPVDDADEDENTTEDEGIKGQGNGKGPKK